MTIPLTIVLITEALDTEHRLVSLMWDMSLTCYPETLHCPRDQSTWDSWPALCWGPEPGRSTPRSCPRGLSERPLGGWASEDHPHRSKHQLNNNLKLQTNLLWSEHLTKILWIVRHWQNQVFLLPFHKFNGIFKSCYTVIITFFIDILLLMLQMMTRSPPPLTPLFSCVWHKLKENNLCPYQYRADAPMIHCSCW